MLKSTIVLMIIFVFTFFPLILAEIARNKSIPTVEDFFLQSRKMPTAMVFFTVHATWMSAFAFLGAGGYFYKMGPVYMTAIAWDILFGVLFMLIGKRAWYYGKHNNYVTPTDFFDDIFGYKPLSILVTLVMIFFTIPYLQIQLSGGAYIIEIASNGMIPWRVAGVLFYLIIIIYLWAGGLRAVAMTDVFYGICLFVSMLFIGFYLIDKAGGLEYVFQAITERNVRNVTLPGPKGEEGALLWICMFITVPIGALMGPQMWLRFYAAEKRKTFNIMPLLLCITAIQCIGTLFAGSAGILLIPDVYQMDAIIPVILQKYGGLVLRTILFCGIASAALSTANSQIHAVAAIYTIDIHRKYINRNIGERNLVSIGKWAVLIVSALAYLLLLHNPQMIIHTGTIGMAGTAQIIVPTAGALLWARSNGKAAALGILGGVVTLVSFALLTDFNISYCAVLALMVNSSLFIIGSLRLKTNAKVKEKIIRYRDRYECKV